MATVATSVEVVPGPLPEAEALDARLRALRDRFPRAIIDRYLENVPIAGARVMLSPGAAVVGPGQLGDDVSGWYGASLRGGLRPVGIGRGSTIQDGPGSDVG